MESENGTLEKEIPSRNPPFSVTMVSDESQCSGSAFFSRCPKRMPFCQCAGNSHRLTDQPQKPQIQSWSIASFTRDLCFSYFSHCDWPSDLCGTNALVRTNQPIEQGSPCEYHWWLYKDPWQRVLLAYHESTEQLRQGRHFRKWWNTLIQKVNIQKSDADLGCPLISNLNDF